MVVSSHQDTGRAINPIWFQAVVEQINREPWKSDAEALRARASCQPSACPSHGSCQEPRAWEGGQRQQPCDYSRSFFGKGCSIFACTCGSRDAGSLAASVQTREPWAFGTHAQSSRVERGPPARPPQLLERSREGGAGSARSPKHGYVTGTCFFHCIASLPLQR